ncbi:MAG: DoxX family protein [Thermonemataceae bacterium]
MIQNLFFRLTRPVVFTSIASNILITIPRVITGLLLTLDFGSSKFGLPWSNSEEPLGFLEVASWFPGDVAEFGMPFSIAPYFFAWMGAASEAIGGLLLAIGFQTRLAAFFIACTMLVAIFFQKWGQGTWGMLPAMGFLWVSLYAMVHGSGKWGIDYLITKGRSVKIA